MIYLHTGLPGAGKTIYTLDVVRRRAQKENRPVFYFGIEILKTEVFPGWQHLDNPELWYELPDGSIIVHDEAQTLYRPRGSGSAVPRYVSELEISRHKGFDLYFITQHPMLVEQNLRRLTGEHCHVVRAFGTGVVTVHKWAEIREQCDKNRSDSVKERWAHPKELFGAYKSATLHTHKSRIPMKVWFFLALPLILGALVYGAASTLRSFFHAGEIKPGQLERVSGQSGGASTGVGAYEPKLGYFEAREPRVKGLPHTAPVYDAVTAVKEAPYPAACISLADRCECYTQQGTRMDTPKDLCLHVVKNGFFVPWAKGGESGRDLRRDGLGGAKVNVDS